MENKIKKIGVITSGGDGPGMNAAIRAITRTALNQNVEVAGIIRGYQGLVDDDVIEMNHRSVSNIIDRGGTILKTARSKEFQTIEGETKAHNTLKKHNIDALVVIGGDGSYRGANEFSQRWKVPIIGLPGTIDNDLEGTDETIGCHTAINTALDAIDKVRDTAHSMERIFVIEVMGNKSGYIAQNVALGAGAEDLIIPECEFDYNDMYKRIIEGYRKGKISWMVVLAEGAGSAEDIAKRIAEVTQFETRTVVLGHVQRGGTPCGADRILATRLGVCAVESLLNGVSGKAIGVIREEINMIDLADAKKKAHVCPFDFYKMVKILT